ncbi:MAG TPA: Ig-like domain-containing protein [archaeon]|nr:Ig-like domain-containing protein [archaeon]
MSHRCLLIGLLVIFPISCARMAVPPGGPEDIEPPRVASVTPATDSTGVAVDTKLKIEFTEKVRKEQVERLVKLSPSAGRLFFKWDGRRLQVKPERPLRYEITYSLCVQPGLTDLHRVKSAERFISYFSTGSTFSPGRIEGQVSWRDSLMAGAVLFASSLGDTSLVFDTETDSTGKYLFPYLPLGTYRLLTFRDLNRNSQLDFTREAGADSVVDLIFEPLKINFQLVLADTTPPFLGSVLTPDSVTVILAFDDLLDSVRGIAEAAFELKTPDSLGAGLAIDSVFLDSTDRRRLVLKLGSPLVPESSYYVASSGVVNEAGLSVLPGRGNRTFRYRPKETKGIPSRKEGGKTGSDRLRK